MKMKSFVTIALSGLFATTCFVMTSAMADDVNIDNAAGLDQSSVTQPLTLADNSNTTQNGTTNSERDRKKRDSSDNKGNGMYDGGAPDNASGDDDY